MSSPSVISQTIDRTHYIPTLTNEVAAFCGYFEKGPIDEPVFITDVNQFKFIFGRGIDLHHNDWYQVYNYLQYSSGIWVTRTSGNRRYNATNEERIFINNENDWKDAYDSLETLGVKIVAQTPGAWGNLLSVAVIEYEQWVNNTEIKDGFYPQDLFTFFEEGYVGICVFRIDKLVERYYKTDQTINEINDESRYIYIKYNTEVKDYVNVIDCLAGDGLTIIDLNTTVELNFSSDLNKKYELLVKQLTQVVDLNASTKLTIYDLNTTIALPFAHDLNRDPTNPDNAQYFTYYGDNIIQLTNGSTNFPTDRDIQASYDIFEAKADYDIDIIIGNDKYNNAAVNLAEARRDVIAFIGMPTSFIEYIKLNMGPTDPQETAYTQTGLILATRETKIPKDVTDQIIKKMLEYLESVPQSQFVHFTANVKHQLDGFTGNNKHVNIAADVAGLKAQASLITPWSTNAGLERGQIKNVNNMYLSIKDVNTYYRRGLNYIENNILMSQKTYYTKPSAFSRVNVRSLFNHIEKEVQKLLRYYVFEENTYRVRGIIASTVRKYLEEVKANRGIDAGKVHVYGQDNEIIVDVYVKPTYVAEYIQLRMNNVGTETFSSVLSNSIG